MKKPWDQQPGEGWQAWEAFREYIALGRARSLSVLAKNRGVNKSMTRHWSAKYKWQRRLAAYNKHMRDVEQKAIETEAAKWARRREETRQREYDAAIALSEKARQMLAYPLKRETILKDGKTIVVEPAEWRMADAAKMHDVASKLARLASEMATSHEAVVVDLRSEARDAVLKLRASSGLPDDILLPIVARSFEMPVEDIITELENVD